MLQAQFGGEGASYSCADGLAPPHVVSVVIPTLLPNNQVGHVRVVRRLGGMSRSCNSPPRLGSRHSMPFTTATAVTGRRMPSCM
jgi:hypothetical protein